MPHEPALPPVGWLWPGGDGDADGDDDGDGDVLDLALSPSKEGRHFWSDGQNTFSHGSLMHGPDDKNIH